MRPLWLVLLMLPGCLDASTPETGDEIVPAVTPMAQAMTFYTTPDMTLVLEEPAPGEVPVPWSHPEQVRSVPPPEWTAQRGGLHVTEARAHLSFKVDGPAIGTQFRGGDLTVWWGSSVSVVSHETPDSAPVFMPGQEYVLDVELEVPLGGIIIPDDEPVRLMVAGYLATQAEPLVLITGAKSVLDVVATPIDVAPEWHPLRHWDGSGSDCVETPRTVYYPFVVANTTTPLRFVLEKTAGEGHPDLDLYIYDGNGTYIAGAHGPGGMETLDLWPPQLANGPGTYQARIVGYCVADIAFRLSMSYGT